MKLSQLSYTEGFYFKPRIGYEWVKKYNIPFSVGIIRDDAEKARFAWGVRSLPWLILTDSSHVIVSQGFSPGDLENQLGQGSP